MKKWLKFQKEYHRDWELDVGKTGYLEEIKRFWEVDAQVEIPRIVRFFPGESGMLD